MQRIASQTFFPVRVISLIRGHCTKKHIHDVPLFDVYICLLIVKNRTKEKHPKKNKKLNIFTGAAYILRAPSNRTTLEGQKIQFDCGAAAFPNNITYRWYFNNRNVLTYNDSRLSVYPDGKLVISPVYKKDMGWYTCRPSNGVGEDPEAAAFLNVTCKEVEKSYIYYNLHICKLLLVVNWFNN